MMVIPLLLVPTLLSLRHLIIPVALIVDILVIVYRLVIFWLLILMSMNLFSLVMASCRIIHGYRFLNLIDRGLARYWLNIAALSESGPVVRSANLPTITATKASTVPSRSSMAISSWNAAFVSTSAKSFTNIPKLVLFNTVHVAVRYLGLRETERTSIDQVHELGRVNEGESVLETAEALLIEPRVGVNLFVILEHILVVVQGLDQGFEEIVHGNLLCVMLLAPAHADLLQGRGSVATIKALVSETIHDGSIAHVPAAGVEAEHILYLAGTVDWTGSVAVMTARRPRSGSMTVAT